MARPARRDAALLVVLLVAAGCSSDRSTSSDRSSTTTPPTGGPASTARPTERPTCGNPGVPPARYQSIVVFAFENRTWSAVGGPGFGAGVPYLRGLATRCAWFADWLETDAEQNSLTQYVGQVTGARQPETVNDCNPSPSCSTQADNLFRQARTRGLSAVNYVEGAAQQCSARGNAAKHVPALYLRGDGDRAACSAQVRPLAQFDPAEPPNFAFITPTLCHDGHDCGNEKVDAWAREHIQPVLGSAAYRAGRVAVFVWYDEDRPVPNLWITPTARPGPLGLAGAGYAGTLRAWESMLGLSCLANACTAPDMRAAAAS